MSIFKEARQKAEEALNQQEKKQLVQQGQATQKEATALAEAKLVRGVVGERINKLLEEARDLLGLVDPGGLLNDIRKNAWGAGKVGISGGLVWVLDKTNPLSNKPFEVEAITFWPTVELGVYKKKEKTRMEEVADFYVEGRGVSSPHRIYHVRVHDSEQIIASLAISAEMVKEREGIVITRRNGCFRIRGHPAIMKNGFLVPREEREDLLPEYETKVFIDSKSPDLKREVARALQKIVYQDTIQGQLPKDFIPWAEKALAGK